MDRKRINRIDKPELVRTGVRKVTLQIKRAIKQVYTPLHSLRECFYRKSIQHFIPLSNNNPYLKEAIKTRRSIKYIKAIYEYSNNLISNDLPVIFSLKHLSTTTGIEYAHLNDYINDTEKYYNQYKIKKKNGGYREISVPYFELKQLQRWILDNILYKKEVHNHAIAYNPQKKLIDNAYYHQDKNCVLNIDLKMFFDSINDSRIVKVFLDLGYSLQLSIYFSKLLTFPVRYFPVDYRKKLNSLNKKSKRVLPQGAPTSPYLSNIVAIKLDKRLSGYAEKNNIAFSRYSDDITFSGLRENLPTISLLRKIIKDEGFKINYKKIRFQNKGTRQVVTGLIVNEKINIPKETRRKIEFHLHYLKKNGVSNHLQNNKWNKSNFRDWLLGNIFFVMSINHDLGNKYLEKFNEINWPLYE